MKEDQLLAHMLYFFNGLSQALIADMLNVNVKTVYRWLKQIDKKGSVPLPMSPSEKRKRLRQMIRDIQPDSRAFFARSRALKKI